MGGDTYHGAIGDETDKGIGWEQAETDDDGIPKCFEILFVETGIDDEKEDGRHLDRTREGVLDGGVFWEQLCGQVCV